MNTTQKRWSTIVNVIYFLIFAAGIFLFMRYAFWMFLPFIVSFVIAAALQKPLRFLTKNKKAPKGIISSVMALIVFAAVAGVIVFAGAQIVYVIKDLITYFTDRCSNLVEFFDVLKSGYLGLEIAKRLPAEINDYITGAIDSFSAYVGDGSLIKTITDNISKIASPLGSVITTVPTILVGFLVSAVATCFMTSEFDKMKKFFLAQFEGDNRKKVIKAKHILISSVGKMVRAYCAIILITTVELTVSLTLLRLIGVYDGAHILIISFLIAIVDIVPILGTGTVVIPWAIYSFATGSVGMGIGLLVIYALITVIRQIIEPKLVAGQVGISPVITIVAMYVGIKIFGAIGIFILPFLVIIIKLLNDEGIIHIFKKVPDEPTVSPDSSLGEEKEGEGVPHAEE